MIGDKVNISACENKERLLVGSCPYECLPWLFRISVFSVFITDRCNLRCAFCYENPDRTYPGNTGVIPFDERQDFPKDKMDALIEWMVTSEQCHVYGDDTFPELVFFGGEPLLVWDYCKEVMDKVKERIRPDFQFHLATNGTLLTDKIVDEINAYGMRVTFGIKRGKYRGIDENKHWLYYYPNEDAIKRIKKLMVNTQFEPDWQDRLYEARVRLEETYDKASMVQMSHVEPIDWNTYDYDTMREQIYLMYLYLMKKRSLTGKVRDGKLRNLLTAICDHERGSHRGKMPCGLGSGMITITTDGTVYPCGGIKNFGDESLAIGEVGHDVAPLNAAKCTTAYCRERCWNCEFLKYCKPACLALHYCYSGRLDEVNDEECLTNKVYVEAAIQAWNDLSDNMRQAIYFSTKKVLEKANQRKQEKTSDDC